MRLEDADRLRTLLDTGIAISSELSLDAVLEQIVEAAAALTGARYAALGVIDPSGTGLERFVTPDRRARPSAIGDLPRGRGILGVLIETRGRSACTTWATTRAPSASRRTTRRCGRSWASRSCCATLPSETST